jgi:hypothetical protein
MDEDALTVNALRALVRLEAASQREGEGIRSAMARPPSIAGWSAIDYSSKEVHKAADMAVARTQKNRNSGGTQHSLPVDFEVSLPVDIEVSKKAKYELCMNSIKDALTHISAEGMRAEEVVMSKLGSTPPLSAAYIALRERGTKRRHAATLGQ